MTVGGDVPSLAVPANGGSLPKLLTDPGFPARLTMLAVKGASLARRITP